MLRTTDVLESIIAGLKSKYDLPVYVREVIDGFNEPCFFIQIVRTQNSMSKNFNSNRRSIMIYYFASDEANVEDDFMDIADDIRAIFGQGFWAGGRHLMPLEVDDERSGERQNILVVTMRLSFFDDTGYDADEGYETMRELTARVNESSVNAKEHE